MENATRHFSFPYSRERSFRKLYIYEENTSGISTVSHEKPLHNLVE